MRAYFYSILIFSCLLSISFNTKAQLLPSRQSTYFSKGDNRISKQETLRLRKLLDTLKAAGPVRLELEGHADNAGDYNKNKLLSLQRARTVKDWLINEGINESDISLQGLGSDYPVATNRTAAGRRRNRRVEIMVSNKEVIIDTVSEPVNISALYKLLETPLQLFCINGNRDTVIRCSQGTVIYIKANALLPVGNCPGACIQFKVKEDLLTSDMILDNLSTTSNGEIIETQGMIYTEAVDCSGNRLQLQSGKDLVIVLPADSINPAAKVFEGNRIHDSVMNWTVNNNSILSNFSLADLDVCGGWICVRPETIDCEPCRFLFCRIGRFGKATLGIFSKNQRAKNIIFRRCQNRLKVLNQPATEIISTSPTVIKIRPSISPVQRVTCATLEALFLKYGVKDMAALILAINKPLLDSFKVTTFAALQDTLAKISRQKIELSYLNKSISFDDFKFYVYNTSSLGWSNVDVFKNIDRSTMTTMKVNLKAASGIDCKLVFKRRRFIIPATKEAEAYHFKGVPAGEEAVIVAIKYENGKPFLALRNIMVANKKFDVEFKELTLQQLKEQLKQLNE